MNRIFSIFSLITIILSIGLFALTSCMPSSTKKEPSPSTIQLVGKIGKPLVDQLQAATSITLTDLRKKTTIELTSGQMEQVKTLILNDTSYVFDRQKRCPFYANYSLLFKGNHQPEQLIRIGLSCAKIEFPDLQLVDCDLGANELSKIFKNL